MPHSFNFIPHAKGQQQPGSDMVEVSHNRLLVLVFCFVVAFAAIGVRLFDVTILGKEEAATASVEDSTPYFERAEILDRNGEVVAINLTTASLYANPHIVLDAEEAAQKVSKVLPELDKAELRAKLKSEKNFVWIKRHLTPKEQQEVNDLGLPGLSFQRDERRVYPHGSLMAHVLGYVGIDGKGLAGIEKQYEDQLHKADSKPLRLSVDVRVQGAVHEALSKSMKEFSAKAATGVVMDVTTGELLAMVSLPDFDPHNPGAGTPDEKFNRATLGVYEMGSTFKTFTMATALDSKKAGMGSIYDVSQPIRVARFLIHDTHPQKGWLSLPAIYMHSSNIGTAKIAMDVGGDTQREYLKKFGLFSPLGIEIPEKSPPLFPQKWGEISTMTVSYGHGMAVTPIHVVQTTAGLVNGGIMHKATLLKTDPAELHDAGERIVSGKTSENIRKLLRLVVEEGTGSKSNISGYLVGGKTGTAEKTQSGGYNRKALLSSFVGVFPMHAPRYVVLTILDEPKGTKATFGYATGGMTAAPTVGEIITKIGPILGVRPVDEDDDEIRKELYVDYETKEHDLASF